MHPPCDKWGSHDHPRQAQPRLGQPGRKRPRVLTTTYSGVSIVSSYPWEVEWAGKLYGGDLAASFGVLPREV